MRLYSVKKDLTLLAVCGIILNISMIDGVEYSKVLEITDKAEYLGFIIIPPHFKQSVIEPINSGRSDIFKVKISEMRYPTIQNTVVHQGNFNSVEIFISGAFVVHTSLTDLGIIDDDKVLTAAQQFILMDKIRRSGM